MATGRVLQFDVARGYGFIAADDGGDDVFLHSSSFDGDPEALVPGTRIEFEVMAGERGRKAYGAHLGDVAAPAAAAASGAAHAAEEGMCDVLSQAEFGQEVTELLLETVPSLTGSQIMDVRRSLLEFAQKRGWVDA